MQCPSCGQDNGPNKKFCRGCGTPLMSAGVGYGSQGQQAGGGAPPRGNWDPTQVETTGPVSHRPAQAQFGGAADPTQFEQPPHGGGFGPQPGARQPASNRPGNTILQEEAAKPLAGWLVVLRSRSLSPYLDVPVFMGQNRIGRSPAHGPQCVADQQVSQDQAIIVAQDGPEGRLVQLTNLSTTNATQVNKRKVQSVSLGDGDLVKMGTTTMVFVPYPG